MHRCNKNIICDVYNPSLMLASEDRFRIKQIKPKPLTLVQKPQQNYTKNQSLLTKNVFVLLPANQIIIAPTLSEYP
jgi:hypothetical protein